MHFKSHTRRAVIGLVLTGVALLLSACGDSGSAEPQAELSPEEQTLQQGQRVARMCAGCHGPEGISRVDSYPSIAGLPEAYLKEQLQAFRSGERDNPMMSSVARNLSDEAVEQLSVYFASLPGASDD